MPLAPILKRSPKMNKVSQALLEILNEKYCRKNFIVPIYEDKKKIILYSVNDDELLNYNIKELTEKDIEFIKKSKDIIIKEIESLFEKKLDDKILDQIKNLYSEDIVIDDLEDESKDSPVAKVLNYILNFSIEKDASDIHIENLEDSVLVRVRIDGSLHELSKFPKNLYPYLITRIKVMAKLDIAEKRLPQDGRFSYNFRGRNIDIRVATSPTAYGEKIVFRILDVGRVDYSPEGIGLSGENLKNILKVISQPQGLVLISGPTSSGKTSTLYTILKYIQNSQINIMTIEDPIEYKIAGINQIEVNENTGLSFERGLKSILRMDPDKIMIGEIRNKETAHIAISASISGHTVFSTIHTENSPAVVGRLIDMGIEPYLVSAGLIGVISQRLIRKLCPHCKEKEISNNPFFKDKEIYKKRGCPKCNGGYKGRIAVFEIMIVDETLKEMISEKKSIGKIKNYAISQGMKTLASEILSLVENGQTSMEEYYRNINTIGEI